MTCESAPVFEWSPEGARQAVSHAVESGDGIKRIARFPHPRSDGEGKQHPVGKRRSRLRFLFTQECLYGCSTDGTSSLHGMSAILHRHLLRVLHFRLLFALDAIGFSHLSLSFLYTEQF